MLKAFSLVFGLAAIVGLTGCESMHHGGHHKSGHTQLKQVKQAVAVMHPTRNNRTHGVVHFIQDGDVVHMTADISGLTPNSRHGFHIHEYGDCSAADGTSAGGHYNPEGHDHALPNGMPRHAGDLGNLQADGNGNATLELTLDNISLIKGDNPILGRGLIIHAKPDDGGQPTGNAGARIACGVIGVDKAE